MKKLSFAERSRLLPESKIQKLFAVAEEKQSNLILSADVTDQKQLLMLAENLGQQICAMKTHIDIVDGADVNFCMQLKALADQQNFLLIEDRKFADIGHTTLLQMTRGPFKISQWADFVTVHLLPGIGILKAFTEIKPQVGVLLLAQMSSKGSFFTSEYTESVLAYTKENPAIVSGIITQQGFDLTAEFAQLTPGVKLSTESDTLGQQYRTPEKAIYQEGCDFVIVGRGIINADNPQAIAEHYRQSAWEAYQRLCNSC